MFTSNKHGGILTGKEIQRQVEKKYIVMDPFDESNLNPNSYNIRLGDTVTIYADIDVIDLKNPDTYDKVREYKIPDDGMILRPGNLYLIRSKEIFGSNFYVPIITGRSSMGRLGIQMHHEAGFGDIGYFGPWTFQLKVSYPTRVYAGLKMAQVYFIVPQGDFSVRYNGHYTKCQVKSQYDASKE